MTSAQKIIKYFALAFAAFLIVSIISGIINAFSSLSRSLLNKNEKDIKREIFVNNDIAELNIEVANTNLKILIGDYLKIETNNSYIDCKQNNDKIEITEKKHSIFSKNNNEELIIYIPEQIAFEKVKINTGVGKVVIATLTTKELSLKVGIGNVLINRIIVFGQTKIEGGAGKINIIAGSLNNLNLDTGIGKTEILSKIIGESKIEAGIGSLDINLIGLKEDYTIKTSKGIGSIKVSDENVSNDETIGNGEDYIDIDGGVGSININFKQIK